MQIFKLVSERKLTQSNAVELLGTTRAQVSALVRCRPVSISIGRLMDFLTILGQDVEVTLKLASTRTTGICQLSFNPANRASPRPFRPEVLLNLVRQVLG